MLLELSRTPPPPYHCLKQIGYYVLLGIVLWHDRQPWTLFLCLFIVYFVRFLFRLQYNEVVKWCSDCYFYGDFFSTSTLSLKDLKYILEKVHPFKIILRAIQIEGRIGCSIISLYFVLKSIQIQDLSLEMFDSARYGLKKRPGLKNRLYS